MSVDAHDRERLARASALARKGHFAVEPNPPVGCVLERDGRIVGEGWHKAFGGPHAEIEALRLAGEAAAGSTAYVSLAPCGHHGQTPPCADALIEAGVARVVYAASDPNPTGGAAGLERLAQAHVRVDGPVPDAQAQASAVRFARTITSPHPWTVLKWAMTLDGRIAPARGRGGQISGRRAQLLAHELRGRADAVAIGIETLLADDPLLTCRLEGGPPDGREQPLRVVFDTTLRAPLESRLVRDADSAPVLLVCSEAADAPRRAALEAAGCLVLSVPSGDRGLDLGAALGALASRGVRRLLVEGGARIHGSLLRDGLAHQVTAFVAPRVLGGSAGVPAVEGTGIESMEGALALEEVMWRKVGDDLLLQGYLPATDAVC